MRELNSKKPEVSPNHKVTVEISLIELAVIRTALAKKSTGQVLDSVADMYGDFFVEGAFERDVPYTLYADAGKILSEYSVKGTE